MKRIGLFYMVLLGLGLQKAQGQAHRDTVISLYFKTGSFELDTAQSAQLSALAPTIALVKQITGFADVRGSLQSNLRLSKRRAEGVATVLKALQLQGPGKPAYKGEADAPFRELWKNRRVDVVASLRTVPSPQWEADVRSISLDNIYFIPDSAVITPESLPLIRDLAHNLLATYPEEHFQIIGHANCQNTLEPAKIKIFYRLSEQRARLIYGLLLEQGVPAERMSYQGIANTQPAVPSPQSVAEKKMNMRVEIRITQRG